MRTPATQARSESEPHLQTKASRLWLWFVAALVLQLGAWTAWLVIASQHKVQEVPLAGARPTLTEIRNPQSEIRN